MAYKQLALPGLSETKPTSQKPKGQGGAAPSLKSIIKNLDKRVLDLELDIILLKSRGDDFDE